MRLRWSLPSCRRWPHLVASVAARVQRRSQADPFHDRRIDAMSTHSDAAPPSEAGPQFKEAIPILRIFSVEKAKEFYVDFLGFAIDWEHRFGDDLPLYMQVSRSELKLHLSEHHGDATPGSTVFIWMRGIAALHRELTAKAYRYARPGLEKAPWDAWVMEVADPFGNRLRFSEPSAPDDPRA